MKVAILGGGLSAAYAWRACLDNNILPDVCAERLFVPPGGFIYAHWLPHSVNDRKLWEPISIITRGSPEEYAAKMWHTKNIKTSFPTQNIEDRGVNPLSAARALWGNRDKLQTQLRVMKLTKEDIQDLTEAYDIIIQTFSFDPPQYHTPIWVIPYKQARNAVEYDGTYENFYIRRSQLFGFLSYEFPPVIKEVTSYLAERYGELNNLVSTKGARLWNAPEIPPPELEAKPQIERYSGRNILYCGRWATGNRKFLSHETYQRVVGFLKEKGYGSRSWENLRGTMGEAEEIQQGLGAALP